MEYYKLSESLNESEVGCIPQSERMILSYNSFKEDSVSAIREGKINFKPDLDGFLLNYKSKITDILTCWQIQYECGLIISPKFLDVLSEFKILRNQIFKAKFYKKQRTFEYYLLWAIESNNNFIDFGESKFYLSTKGALLKKAELNINRNDVFFSLRRKIEKENQEKELRERSRIRLEKLVLNKQKINLDFFRIEDVYDGFFISEILLEALFKAKVTGFDYINANQIKIKVHNVNRREW